MKWLIRIFFKSLRAVLTPPMLLLNWLTLPRGIVREPARQQEVNTQTRDMRLYQYRACPFCIKVRRAIRRLSLDIETRDALRDPVSRAELQQGGGRLMVPCLRLVENGQERWLYESDEIVTYLEARFACH
jgi:glutaredoxin